MFTIVILLRMNPHFSLFHRAARSSRLCFLASNKTDHGFYPLLGGHMTFLPLHFLPLEMNYSLSLLRTKYVYRLHVILHLTYSPIHHPLVLHYLGLSIHVQMSIYDLNLNSKYGTNLHFSLLQSN
jgi:hypothetical protein